MLRAIGFAVLVLGSSFWAAPAAFAQNLVPCARENEFCRVPYPTQVVYGVPGRRTAVEVDGRGVQCSNDVFGDPARGIPKRCAYRAQGYGERGGGEQRYQDRGPYRENRAYRAVDAYSFRGRESGYDAPAWRTCAAENGFCNFGGAKRVRYGVRGRFVEGTYRNGTACSNSVFGDPVPGQPKICQALD